MKVETQEVEYCKMKIMYEADPDTIENKRSEVLLNFKNAPVPGNRKGRASLDAVRLYYYSQIEKALEQVMAEHAFHEGIHEAGIKPFGTPEFESIELKRNKFTCAFVVNYRPKFELAQYKGLEVPKQNVELDVAVETEQALQSMRTRFGESAPYGEEDFVQDNDVLILDYEAFDGETKLDSVSGTGQIITVGKSGLPGLDEGLYGMKLGEIRDIALVMPQHTLPSIAGKTLNFRVTLIMGSKITPMPLNDELAKKAGKQNLDELRTFVAGVADAKKQEMERSAHSQQIMNRLLESNAVKIPDWLVLSEGQYLASSANAKWETLSDMDKEEYLKVGEKNVKMALILDEIRNNEPDAQLSDQEVLRIVEQNLGKAGHDQKQTEEAMMEMNKNGQLPLLAARIKDEHTIDFLIKNTTFVE